ncbi:MAG: hypothetical protein KDK23_14515 [Leptospiraceae bacterium]|nr:hypothetical protein [Leptospiraceae bacterium]
MKKILHSLLVLAACIGISACAYTREYVSTGDAAYRFKNTGNSSTEVERCEIKGNTAQCRDVQISFE